MSKGKLFFILTLFCNCLNITNSFAQKKVVKPAVVAPIPEFKDLINEEKLLVKVPINRQIFHDNVRGQLTRIDKLDGKADLKIANFRGENVDKTITNNIYKKGFAVQNFIENVTWNKDAKQDHTAKLLYLRQLQDNLKLFCDAARTGSFEIDYYSLSIENLKGMLIAKQENRLPAYVAQNGNMGTYLNRSLLGADSATYDVLLNEMCSTYPAFFVDKIETVAKYKNADNVLEYLLNKDALKVLNYANSTTPVAKLISKSSNPRLKAISVLGKSVRNSSRSLCYLDDYVDGKMTLAQVKNICENEEEYFKGLVNLKQKNITNTPYIVQRDIKSAVSDYVRKINELHDMSAEVRFKSIANFTDKELYYLAVYGGDEIYTSSFLGVFNRLIKKLGKQTGYEFLENVQMDNFRTFVRMCANYNTLDPFLASMPAEKQNDLMRNFVSGLGDGKKVNLDGATEVADAFGSINNKLLIENLQADVDQELNRYKLQNNTDATNVYYILKSLLSSKTNNANDEAFATLMRDELKIPPIDRIPLQGLVDTVNNTISELMFFYGDEDGKGWYNRFIGGIKSSGKFTVNDANAEWVVITAKNAKIPFTLYANKPLDEPKDEFAQNNLAQFLLENNITPSILVHRGHSYHLENTIKSIYDAHKIIILGSCGGYHNLGTILGQSPDAHITSSKQVGKGNINSKIIDEVNFAVIKGDDVIWPNIYEKINKTMPAADKSEWNDYVFPHKNLGALFLKAFKNLSNN